MTREMPKELERQITALSKRMNVNTMRRIALAARPALTEKAQAIKIMRESKLFVEWGELVEKMSALVKAEMN